MLSFGGCALFSVFTELVYPVLFANRVVYQLQIETAFNNQILWGQCKNQIMV